MRNKNTMLCATAALMIFTTNVSAQDKQRSSRWLDDESQCKPCGKTVDKEPVTCELREFNDYLRTGTRGDFHIRSDFLYWRVQGDGLPFAVKGELDTVGAQDPIRARVHNAEYSFESGVRVGIGYNFLDTLSDMQTRWTHICSKTTKKESALAPKALHVVWANVGGTGNDPHDTATNASAKWDLGVDLWDLSIGHTCVFSKWFSMRPFFGLQALWIDQNFNVDYRGLAGTDVTDIEVRMSNDFSGFGPYTGIEMNWPFWAGMTFFGEWRMAYLYGQHETKHKETLFGATPGVKLDVSDDFHAGRLVFNYAIGARWDHTFGKGNCWHIGLHAAWEGLTALRQNQMLRNLNGSATGSFLSDGGAINLNGLTIGATLGF